jgi:hypothetical protein
MRRRRLFTSAAALCIGLVSLIGLASPASAYVRGDTIRDATYTYVHRGYTCGNTRCTSWIDTWDVYYNYKYNGTKLAYAGPLDCARSTYTSTQYCGWRYGGPIA